VGAFVMLIVLLIGMNQVAVFGTLNVLDDEEVRHRGQLRPQTKPGNRRQQEAKPTGAARAEHLEWELSHRVRPLSP